MNIGSYEDRSKNQVLFLICLGGSIMSASG